MKLDCSHVPRLFPGVPMSVPGRSARLLSVVLGFLLTLRFLSTPSVSPINFWRNPREPRNNRGSTYMFRRGPVVPRSDHDESVAGIVAVPPLWGQGHW